MKKESILLINVILLIIIGGLCMYIKDTNVKSKRILDEIVYVDSINKISTTIYYDQKIQSLKEENKELYDSLKYYKNELDLVIVAKYENQGKVEKEITSKIDSITNDSAQIFTYINDKNDSLKYELKIASVVEPKWYSLKYKITDKILITNKQDGDLNQLDIKTDNGIVTPTVVVHTPEKTSIWDYISIGPSVGIAYTTSSHTIEPYVGIGVTYNLFRKKK